MKIDPKLAKAFNQAVTLNENLDSEGNVNWNFVDADCYMAMTAGSPLFDTREEGQSYVDQFEYLAACYSGEVTLADRIQQEFKIEIDGEDFTFLTQEEYDAISIDKSKPINIKEVV